MAASPLYDGPASGSSSAPPVSTGPPPESHDKVVRMLQDCYKEKILPNEEFYCFHPFGMPKLRDADLAAKPTVLLLGQYSTGKTSFIRYLLGRDFPGMHIGPEPTTDGFTSLGWGKDDVVIPGAAATVSPDQPYSGLANFGAGFLQKFKAVECNADILQYVTLIDTPGVLSGEKQRLHRSYEFTEVVSWFAYRADLILLLFDAHKLDISDEFRAVISTLVTHDDKVRVVLNKSDTVSKQQLMRVYGALMWSLGKVFQSPEVKRVYIGSFWERPPQNDETRPLLLSEMNDLLDHIRDLPSNAAVRKVNEFVKRIRAVRVHCLLIAELKSQMPALWGHEKAKNKLLDSLPEVFNTVHRVNNIPVGDFPDWRVFAQVLRGFDFSNFNKFNQKRMDQIQAALEIDVPAIMDLYTHTTKYYNPFQESVRNAPEDAPDFTKMSEWAIPEAHKVKSDKVFATMEPDAQGKVTGQQAQAILTKSNLPFDVLATIWRLSDIDRDGKLDAEEFAIALFLSYAAMAGHPVPDPLPYEYYPVSKRLLYEAGESEDAFRATPPPRPTTTPTMGGSSGARSGKGTSTSGAGAGGGGGGGGGGAGSSRSGGGGDEWVSVPPPRPAPPPPSPASDPFGGKNPFG